MNKFRETWLLSNGIQDYMEKRGSRKKTRFLCVSVFNRGGLCADMGSLSTDRSREKKSELVKILFNNPLGFFLQVYHTDVN
jgi:hypothetical protein